MMLKDKKKNKIPLGFIIIIIYLIYTILSLISAIFSKTAIFFGYILSESFATFYYLINMLIYILIIYAIAKRKIWGWILAMVFFSLELLEGIISFLNMENILYFFSTLSSSMSEEVIPEVAPIMAWIILIMGTIISASILIYFYKKKNYFGR